jgi:hypothetical protein
MISRVEEAKIASDFRSKTVSELVSRIESTNTITPKSILILNLPCRLPNSESKIEIFCTSWDAKGALRNLNTYFNFVEVITDRNFPFNEITHSEMVEQNYVVVRFNAGGNIISVKERTQFKLSDLNEEIGFARKRDGLNSLNNTRCRNEFLSALSFDSEFGLIFHCLLDPLPNL